MGIILGGPNSRFQRRIGDIMVSYQYLQGERAMALWPVYRSGVPAFIVCDSAAWQYDNPKYLAAQARTVANLWGEAPDSRRWFQIAQIIHDGLQDLVRLKPAPDEKENGPVIGDATLHANGKAVASGEVFMPSAADLQRYERTLN